MKSFAARVATVSFAFLASGGVALAHPGHEGHELTWDFSHLAHHPIATMGCAALVGASACALLQVFRGRAASTQSLRVLQPSRGK